MSNCALETRGLTKNCGGAHALDGACFTLHGEIVAAALASRLVTVPFRRGHIVAALKREETNTVSSITGGKGNAGVAFA